MQTVPVPLPGAVLAGMPTHVFDDPSVRRTVRLRSPKTWRWDRLFEPVDAASLALFRIAFGALMVWEVWRYWSYGWIKLYFVDPTFFFRFPGFEWLPTPSESIVYALWFLMGLGAAGMTLGCWYRLSTALVAFPFLYFFLLDASNYLNHFYLICLLSGIMLVVPADRIWSIRAWRSGGQQTIPAWTIWLLRVQVGIPYFYGGIAKLDRDWLLGIPMQHMLFRNIDLPIVGRYLYEWWTADLFAFGGLLFDLLVVPLLIWKRTRPIAFLACLLFHLTNKLLLNIGIFPWMMIAATTLFFEPDWPRRLPGVPGRYPGDETPQPASWTFRRRSLVVVLGAWVFIQVTVPLRHYFYAGNTNWTEIGHRFSWRMKLRSKEALLTFYLINPETDEVMPFDPTPYITQRQFLEMAQHPDMILQFARFLGEQLDEIGYGDFEVRAEAWCSLNSREPQLLIDPEADLSRQPRGTSATDWILPLEDPPGERQQRALTSLRKLRAQAYSSPSP